MPQAEQRVQVPPEGHHPRIGRDVIALAVVPAHPAQVHRSSRVDAELGAHPWLEGGGEIPQPAGAAEPDVLEAGEVAQHRQALDVVADIARRPGEVGYVVVEQGEADGAGRRRVVGGGGMGPAAEVGEVLADGVVVAIPLIQLLFGTTARLLHQGAGQLLVTADQEAAGQGDEVAGLECLGVLGDPHRRRHRFVSAHHERCVDRFHGDQLGEHRLVHLGELRPGELGQGPRSEDETEPEVSCRPGRNTGGYRSGEIAGTDGDQGATGGDVGLVSAPAPSERSGKGGQGLGLHCLPGHRPYQRGIPSHLLGRPGQRVMAEERAAHFPERVGERRCHRRRRRSGTAGSIGVSPVDPAAPRRGRRSRVGRATVAGEQLLDGPQGAAGHATHGWVRNVPLLPDDVDFGALLDTIPGAV